MVDGNEIRQTANDGQANDIYMSVEKIEGPYLLNHLGFVYDWIVDIAYIYFEKATVLEQRNESGEKYWPMPMHDSNILTANITEKDGMNK